MKGMSSTLFTLALLVPLSVTFVASEALSPVTRVVQLLTSLATNLEAELKKETDLMVSFNCWAKTVTEAKTASNAAAQSRIQTLEQLVSDIDSGRVEFTSERKDLSKEVADVTSDIEAATDLRNKEHADYLAAKGEMEKAITALQDAIAVLREASSEQQSGSLLRTGSRISQGFHTRLAEAASLKLAVEVGRNYLSVGDAHFLERLLSGEAPVTKDWKKLNRKAVFKAKYEARSGEIVNTLEKLLASFQEGMSDAEQKETDAQNTFDTLMTSKNNQKDAAVTGLNDMTKETAAKELSKTDAEAELSDLRTQIENDEQYIKETAEALATKNGEWDTRKTLRVGEIAAINKAISILRDDDARDLFKRSLASQSSAGVEAAGTSFIQRVLQTQKARSSLSAGMTFEKQRGSAATVLREAAKAANDSRLALLADKVQTASKGAFDAVISAIDELISALEEEGTTDQQTKEQCEADRAADTQEASDISHEIDDLTEQITTLEGEIEQLAEEIESKKEEIVTIEAQMKEAQEIRGKEHAAWVESDRDDEEAEAVVKDAVAVLTEFYSQNGLALLLQRRKQAPEVVAGEAPPPPPATWEEPYQGAQESQGIIGMLNLIAEDIVTDRNTAKETEDASETAYQSFVTESNEQIGTLNESISTLTGQKGEKEGEVATNKETRATKKAELEAVMQRLKDAKPGCDFFLINFDVRASNRQIEIDSLNKAKGFLESYEPAAPAASA